MTYPNPSTALASVVIDELVRGGLELVVAAPGSRSTALVLAAAARSDLQLVMSLDERSAAFQALGWCKASGSLAAVISTSGTAVANLLPAVVEADAAGAPLVLLTADRPAELRGVGANQTIEQSGLFGNFARLLIEIGPAEYRTEAPRWWRSMTAQAVSAARGWQGRPGPVHMDLAFREPTVAVPEDGRSSAEPYPFEQAGRPDRRLWTETTRGTRAAAGDVSLLVETLAHAERGVIVAGGGSPEPEALVPLSTRLGWPLIATAESGARRADGVISTGHHLLAAHSLEPDLLLRFGTPGPSRRVIDLASRPVTQVVVSGSWTDPGRFADVILDVDGAALAHQLAEQVSDHAPGEWLSWWQTADRAMRVALDHELGKEITEPAVAATVGAVPADVLVVASSMPIRDVESFVFAPPPLVANRGASGIDGLVSTALGVARSAARTLVLAGDLSVLHDANGFMTESRPDCVFVVIDNGGGGIFSFLPQAEHVGEPFERLFSTPHGRDLGVLAEFHGLGFTRVESTDEIIPAVERGWDLGGCHLVVASTDRSDNVSEHRRLDAVAREVLGALPPPP